MMAKMKGTKSIVTLSLDTEILGRVDVLADAQGLSRSALVESWIRQEVDTEEMTINALTDPTVLKALMQAFGNVEVLKAIGKAAGAEMDAGQVVKFREKMQLLDESPKAVKRSKKASKGKAGQ